ncbi:hypothetical protein [Thioalkalivibrio sp. AKL12]|uniref:DUF6941 family protein n=1 Tax=Thioalkalivibrio sp. AKL12 TaxID=1158159 RepID=UPI0003699186|nr:hypothetical protein [Thioalkalivibrio sp. AKL12]
MPANPKTPRLGDLLICDDVRLEADGRYSLMGVYPGSVVTVHQLPTIISQLAFCFRFSGVTPTTKADFVFRSPDGHEARPISANPLQAPPETEEAIYIVHAAPLQVSQPGEHRIFIKASTHILETSFRIAQPK